MSGGLIVHKNSEKLHPKSAGWKIFDSMMGGSVNCILDLLPFLMNCGLRLRTSSPNAEFRQAVPVGKTGSNTLVRRITAATIRPGSR